MITRNQANVLILSINIEAFKPQLCQKNFEYDSNTYKESVHEPKMSLAFFPPLLFFTKCKHQTKNNLICFTIFVSENGGAAAAVAAAASPYSVGDQ